MFGLFRNKKNLKRYGGSIALGLDVFERYERACIEAKKEIIIQLHVGIYHSPQGDDSICRFHVFTFDAHPWAIKKDEQEAFEALYSRVPPCDSSENNYECVRDLYRLSTTDAEKVLKAVVKQFNDRNPHCVIKKEKGRGPFYFHKYDGL